MRAFVIVTKQNNVIVVDGGRPEDMPLLKEYIGGRHISAWFLTHPHGDHISGILKELETDGAKDFDIEAVYYNFPPYDEWMQKTEADVPDYKYFMQDSNSILPAFLKRGLPILGDKAHVITQGESIDVDECHIDVIFSFHDGLYSNPMNDSSLVFKVTTPNKTVLFLGDLGPDGGDVLFDESRHLLKSDIVQMAHHGHMNVGMNVYAAIAPDACMWCCADWLYNEPEIPKYLENREKLRRMGRIRMYGTALTRQWMELLGVKTHYVTKDGTNRIVL